MTLKPVLTALMLSGMLAGCVDDRAAAPLSATAAPAPAAEPALIVGDGRFVPVGTLCEHLIDRVVNKVSGCEGYVKLSGMTPREAAEIASLNSRFAAEVAPIVNFEFDKADLTPAGRAILDAQAAWMVRFVNLRFSVFGHTDLVGSEGYNFDLAKRRAETVVAYLASKGVPSDQLEALVSYGETRPIIPVDKREALNRRTVTEVTGYITVPRLRTKVLVSCSAVKAAFIASYPTCLNGPGLPPVRPLPPLPDSVSTSNTTAENTTNATHTDASVTYSYTADGSVQKVTETNGSAGNGNVTTGVKVTETKDKLVREIKLNGQTTMTVTSNPDGSDPQVQWNN